jgi:UDP-N-acetylmuramoylalanine--D-glutamate ligase
MTQILMDAIDRKAAPPVNEVKKAEIKQVSELRLKNNIPVYVSESLFVQYADGVEIVGVTGTRGKSMTTQLIYEILKDNIKGRSVYLGGNVRSVSTLALMSKVKKGDIVVMELDSWALHGMGDIKVSPHISVFTTFMRDHMNFYRDDMGAYFADKANIFKYQSKDDVLVIRPGMKKLINKKDVKGKLVVANKKDVEKYKFAVLGDHQRENLACAVEVAKLYKISEANIKKSVKAFKGIEGRLQFVKEVDCLKIYNDNNATTPEATSAGLEALGVNNKRTRIILIAGGADKNLDTTSLEKSVNKYCKKIVLLPGTGTDKLIKKNKFKVPVMVVSSLQDAVKNAQQGSKKGDILLFSPAFASFGMFNNEYDRNDQFMKIINKLK